jgi:hypothetical protein
LLSFVFSSYRFMPIPPLTMMMRYGGIDMNKTYIVRLSERVRLPNVLTALPTHDRKHLGDAIIAGVFSATKAGVDAGADMAGCPVAPGNSV